MKEWKGRSKECNLLKIWNSWGPSG
ncbi:hypothetical protein Golax_007929, partial [Gossypium laxum]|nr:hypothetical protein [Gossypium laxum]